MSGKVVAILGATGVVGQQMLQCLEERNFPVERLVPLASPRSVGKTIKFRGEDVTVQLAEPDAFEGVDIVLGAAGDGTAKELLPEAVKRGAVLVNMGTGGQISILSDQYFTAPGIEARPIVPGKYLLAGSALCGGRAYAILEKFFRAFASEIGAGSEPLYDVLGRLAEKGAAMEDPMTAVTTFSGTRVDPALRGSISNISEDNFTPASLSYAILDGMAQELYQMYETIHEGTGITADHLVASGNGLRMNPMLQDIFRKKFHADLTMSRYKEEAASGAAVSSYTKVE